MSPIYEDSRMEAERIEREIYIYKYHTADLLEIPIVDWLIFVVKLFLYLKSDNESYSLTHSVLKLVQTEQRTLLF